MRYFAHNIWGGCTGNGTIYIRIWVFFSLLALPVFLSGDISEADSLRQLIRITHNDSLLGEYYIRLGVLTDETNPQLSIELTQKALDHFTKADFPLGRARALNSMGYNHWLMGQYTTAISYYTEALTIYKTLNKQSGIARVTNNLGAIYWGLNDYNKALEYYQQSLAIRKMMDDRRGESIVLNNIGMVYQEWQLFDQAIQYHHQAVKIAENLDDREAMAYSYYNMGRCFEAQKRTDQALEYFRTAYDEYRKGGKIGGATSLVLRGMGDLYFHQGHFADALYYYRRALSDALLESNIYRGTHARLSMAKTFFAIDETDSARIYAGEVLETAKAYKYDQFLRDIYYLMADMEVQKGNHEKALNYFKMASAIDDSIFNEEKSSRFTELQIQHNLLKKERENELLRKDNEIQMLRIRRERVIRYSFMTGTLLVLIALGVLYRQRSDLRRLNQSMAQEIQERKAAEARIASLLEEKEILLKEVHHRIKNNLNTVRSLLTLQARSLTDPGARQALKDASNRVQSMSLLYERLYKSENVHAHSTREYFSSLVYDMIHVFPNSKQVTVKTEIEDFMLSVKILSDLGIIVTELITNAMKYAFSEDRCGVIRFQLFQRDTQLVLKLCNNGVPLPDNFSPENTGGFGLQLVSMLIQQLNGSLNVHSHEETCFVIEFPKPETEG